MKTMTCRRSMVGPGEGVGAPRSDTVCGSGACGGNDSVVGSQIFCRTQPCFGSKGLLIIEGLCRLKAYS